MALGSPSPELYRGDELDEVIDELFPGEVEIVRDADGTTYYLLAEDKSDF